MTDRVWRTTHWQRIRNESPTVLLRLGRACASALMVCALFVSTGCFWGGKKSGGVLPAVTTSQRASRTELGARLADLDRQLAAGGGGKALASLRLEATVLRNRLEEGDFRVGDRFLITISQDAQQRSDTASVRDSLMVSLVGLPDVSLKGTLRAELNDKLSAHVARFLRNSTVRTIVFTRVAILGAVSRPGFFVAPPDRPISELLMVAGGTLADANLNDLQVYRNGSTLLDKKEARTAFNEGRTLEELDVQSGDEIRIPLKKRFSPQAIVQVVFFASSIFLAIVQFIRFYYTQQTS